MLLCSLHSPSHSLPSTPHTHAHTHTHSLSAFALSLSLFLSAPSHPLLLSPPPPPLLLTLFSSPPSPFPLSRSLSSQDGTELPPPSPILGNSHSVYYSESESDDEYFSPSVGTSSECVFLSLSLCVCVCVRVCVCVCVWCGAYGRKVCVCG